MDRITLAILAFPILFGFLALRVPVGISMFVVGSGGTILIAGWLPIISQVKTSAWHLFSNYSLSVIPLFLLMGNFAAKAGMSQALFRFTGACFGHYRGGAAMAAVGACAGFGAICGSSIATAATMGRVALPELRKLGYSGALSTGALAAGGTLGILIPPSVILIIYSILTEQNIAKMFSAAFIPGLIALVGYILTIHFTVRFNPEAGPRMAYVGFSERLHLFKLIWKIILIFFTVIGGIYLGWFTPTEGAAVGVAGTGLLAFFDKNFKFRDFQEVVEETAISSAMIFIILLGAEFFNSFIALTQVTNHLSDWIFTQQFSPYTILIIILLIYLFMGCLMDSLAMILLTIPVFFPILMSLDFGLSLEDTAIWFGILTLIVVEVGLITPPVGLNVFVINKLAKNVTIVESFKGVLPFVASDILRIILLVLFPSLTLFLVHLIH